MSRVTLESQLHLVHDGLITFDACVRKTRSEWLRMARHLAKQWRPPPWYEAETDVMQELLLEAWRRIWQWDRYEGGAPLIRYVIWHAMGYAKREIHVARGAILHGNADKNPSRFEVNVSAFINEGGDDASADAWFENILSEEAIAETALLERDERIVAAEPAFAACETIREHAAITALAEAGNIDGGAALLYANKGMRSMLRLNDVRAARSMVSKVTRSIIRRLDTTV